MKRNMNALKGKGPKSDEHRSNVEDKNKKIKFDDEDLELQKSVQVYRLPKTLVVPDFGTSFSIRAVSKSGRLISLPIIPTAEAQKFYALFDEDDVDFRIRVDNSACIDRRVQFELAVHETTKAFIMRPGKTCELETLESRGKKLHFIRQSGDEGQVSVGKYAAKHGMTFDAASTSISQIRFTIQYSNKIATVLNDGPDSFHIKVETQCRSVILKVSSSCTIDQIIRAMRKIIGKHCRYDSWFYKRPYNGDETLSVYDINEGDTLYLEEEMRGGGCRDPDAEEETAGERGAIVFGARSSQQFFSGTFTKDPTVVIDDFTIELRLNSKFSIG